MKVLFISHEASRTGAPIILLDFLTWIKCKNIFEFELLLLKRGEIENSFSEITKINFWEEPDFVVFNESRIKKVLSLIKLQKSKKSYKEKLIDHLSSSNFDFIYCNTIVSLKALPFLKSKIDIPVICHIHEMGFSIATYFKQYIDDSYLNLVNNFICVSISTLNSFKQITNINSDRLHLIYEFRNLKNIKDKITSLGNKKTELKIDFVVGASGMGTWRKGVDLFIQLSREIEIIRPDLNFKFIWVGEVVFDIIKGYEYENNLLGLKNTIEFIGISNNPYIIYDQFDIFVLTSREDPFPLVCIEALMLKKPIICFEHASGITEILDSNSGIIVPFLDIKNMALAIINLNLNPKRLSELSENIYKKSSDFDIENNGSKIIDLINNTVLSKKVNF